MHREIIPAGRGEGEISAGQSEEKVRLDRFEMRIS